jgi:hypothetical protein
LYSSSCFFFEGGIVHGQPSGISDRTAFSRPHNSVMVAQSAAYFGGSRGPRGAYGGQRGMLKSNMSVEKRGMSAKEIRLDGKRSVM